MGRSPFIPAILVTVALLAGFGFGFYFGSENAATPLATTTNPSEDKTILPTASATTRDPSDPLLKLRVRELEEELDELKRNQATAILDDRIDYYYKWPDHTAPSSFDDNLKVTDAMADFLKMTTEQRKTVEAHLAQVASELRKLVQANLKLSKQDADSVTYQIAAFPEGKAIHDKLTSLIEGDLGTARAGVFLGSSRWQINQSFYNFGERPTTITVQRSDQSGTVPQYELKETFGDGSGTSQSIGNHLPPRFEGVLQLDPSP